MGATYCEVCEQEASEMCEVWHVRADALRNEIWLCEQLFDEPTPAERAWLKTLTALDMRRNRARFTS